MGPKDGLPVLLLHGYSDSSFSFSRIVDLLPADWRLIIPDQRGHGESDKPPEGYTPADLAKDAVALLDALGIASAAVIGHSMGSFVGKEMAVLAPERVSRLVLVGSGAASDTEPVRSMIPAVESLADPVDREFVREFQYSTIYRPVPDAFMNTAIAESLKLPARVWKAILAGLLQPAANGYSGIRCPVRVLWGDRDAIFARSDQDELLRQIPGAHLHVFENVGHAPHWEAPELVADALSNAVTKITD
jgi:pimeloyl-ACP methyl ester carboxylesterase